MFKIIYPVAGFFLLAVSPVSAQTMLDADANANANMGVETERGTGMQMEAQGNAEGGAEMDTLDMDADGNGIPTEARSNTSTGAAAGAGANANADAGIAVEEEGVERTVRSEASMQAQQRGTSMSAGEANAAAEVDLSALPGVAAEVCTSAGDCDDADANTMLPAADGTAQGSMRVTVSGSSVRGWSDEQKAAATQRAQAEARADSAADFGLRVAAAAIADDAVETIVAEENETRVQYRTELQVLGFLPVAVTATARANADGTTDVDLPWYAALSTGSQAAVYSQLAADIHADLMAGVSGGA